MIHPIATQLGDRFIRSAQELGTLGLFVWDALKCMFFQKINFKRLLYHINFIGVSSVSIVFLVGAAIGAVLALQSYVGLERFGSTHFVGPIVFLSMAREFGPVLTALMVIGRAGSAITAELGSMRISEQIDALETLSINPMHYLVAPRIAATTIILPFLSIICTFFGILAGYITAVYVLGINPETYTQAIRTNAKFSDLANGIIKALIFGFIIGCIATYKGFFTRGGAKGLGIATTQSVVFANVTIIITDYILTSLMFTK